MMTVQEQERREKQREWRKQNIIDKINEYGILDTVPHLASKHIAGSKPKYLEKRSPQR